MQVTEEYTAVTEQCKVTIRRVTSKKTNQF